MTEEKRGFFGRLRERLSKTRSAVADGIKRVFTAHGSIDESFFEELEEVLIEADFGVDTAMGIVEDMREKAHDKNVENAQELLAVLKEDLVALLTPGNHVLTWDGGDGPHVTLIAGVNGSGKTTTAGKLASHLKSQGKTVLLGAADTFRAAAVEQLTIWSERTGTPIIKDRKSVV